jgi:hypothetical protein
MDALDSIKARIRLSQAKSYARNLMGIRASREDIEAACELAAEQFPEIAPAILRDAIFGEHQRAMESASMMIASANIAARTDQAYRDLTGRSL